MRQYWRPGLIVVSLLSMAVAVRSQQAPKLDRTGNSVSTVLNDSTETVTIEYHSSTEWLPIKLQSGKDTKVAADRIRVTTTREDKAIISVDLPVQAGKKYRLFWNAQLSIWDFSPAS